MEPEPVVEQTQTFKLEPAAEEAQDLEPEPVVKQTQTFELEPAAEEAQDFEPESAVEQTQTFELEPAAEEAQDFKPEPVVEQTQAFGLEPVTEEAQDFEPEPVEAPVTPPLAEDATFAYGIKRLNGLIAARQYIEAQGYIFALLNSAYIPTQAEKQQLLLIMKLIKEKEIRVDASAQAR